MYFQAAIDCASAAVIDLKQNSHRSSSLLPASLAIMASRMIAGSPCGKSTLWAKVLSLDENPQPAYINFQDSERADFARCVKNARKMGAITQLVAGVPVSDLDASIDWYTRFFGRPPDMRVGDEVLWDIDEHATLFIEPNAEQAGAGRITFAVDGLDALLERLAAQRIEHEPIETYSNGVRHVNIPDPDGNRIAFAEPPDTASA